MTDKYKTRDDDGNRENVNTEVEIRLKFFGHKNMIIRNKLGVTSILTISYNLIRINTCI